MNNIIKNNNLLKNIKIEFFKNNKFNVFISYIKFIFKLYILKYLNTIKFEIQKFTTLLLSFQSSQFTTD